MTNDLLSALFETADDGIVVCDLQGKIVFANRAAARINDNVTLPENPKERVHQYGSISGESFSKMRLEDLPALRAIHEKNVKGQEIVLVTSKGERKHLLSNSRALYSANGEIVGSVVIFHDRTALFDIEEQKQRLEKECNELHSLNIQLENFSAVAAHDLKSPLNSITQFIELLKEELGDKVGPNELKLMNYITGAGNRLRSLIDDLLAYARSGGVMGEKEFVDLNAEVREILALLKIEIVKNNVEIQLAELPVVFANKTGMQQLFQNLISNALKYGRAAQAIVRICAEKREGAWCLTVEDNGRGMSDNDQEHAFELFKRFEGSAGREGTGLGLPICKRIVESHGGRIWIDSKKGAGTKVSFLLTEK